MRPFHIASICIAVGLPLTPCAANEIDVPSPVPEARLTAARRDGLLEGGRATVKDTLEWMARGIDGWFGDVPPESPPRVLRGGIGLRTLWRQDAGWDLAARFDIRLDLPNLRDRAYLLIGRDEDRAVVTDQPEVFTRQEQLLQERPRDNRFFLGLGLPFGDAIELRAGIRGGYKLYTQARFGHQWQPTERGRLEFRETLFWTVVEGFGSTTVLNYDHAYSRSLALRWQTAGTISQRSGEFSWSSSLGLYKVFGGNRLLSLEALVNGTPARVDVSEYGLRARWEQPVYRDWLRGEVVIGHFWPRKDTFTERGRSWAAGVGVLMRF